MLYSALRWRKTPREFYEELKKRLAKFHLELSEEKSKIIPFGRKMGKKSGKFDFLGFTHIIGVSRRGNPVVKYRTSEKKLKAKRGKIKKFLIKHMHKPSVALINALNIRLQGHYNYYGISYNMEKLRGFCRYCEYTLYKVLNHRSQKRSVTWDEFHRLLDRHPLKAPKIVFSMW